MTIVNESRAFYNTSFDHRMTKFAKAMELKEKRKKLKPKSVPFQMTTEFTLPSLESVLQTKPNDAATALNIMLMRYEDDVTSDNESNVNTAAI